MTELREVFEMVTKQAEPDVDAWREQERRQRRASRNRRLGALAVAAAIGLVAVVVVIRAADDGTWKQPGGRGTDTSPIPTPESIPALSSGSVEPGRYFFSSSDADLDATYEIVMTVPEGYSSALGSVMSTPRREVSAKRSSSTSASRWKNRSSEPLRQPSPSGEGRSKVIVHPEGARRWVHRTLPDDPGSPGRPHSWRRA